VNNNLSGTTRKEEGEFVQNNARVSGVSSKASPPCGAALAALLEVLVLYSEVTYVGESGIGEA
jgi:hypothetical protein